MGGRARFATLAAASLLGFGLASACGGDSGPKPPPPESQTRTAAGIATREAGITPLAGVTVAAGNTTVLISTSSIGAFLTDAEGRTLYTSANDSDGRSVCLRSCASIWPPLTIGGASPSAPAGLTGTLGTITREDDGSTQVTYNGRPLYRYGQDAQPGDAKGNGIGSGIWVVAVP